MSFAWRHICPGARGRWHQTQPLINNINTVHCRLKKKKKTLNFREELSYLWSHFTRHIIIILQLLSRGRLFQASRARAREDKEHSLRLTDIIVQVVHQGGCLPSSLPVGLKTRGEKLHWFPAGPELTHCAWMGEGEEGRWGRLGTRVQLLSFRGCLPW